LNYLFLLFFTLINSCATFVSPNKGIPSYISQEGELFYIHLIFDHIPTYSFVIDETEISPDHIRYQKTSLGHLIKVPVSEGQKDFKVQSPLKTYLHKKIRLKEKPRKLMMLASFSLPNLRAIQIEDPDLLIVFSPPSTQYYTDSDFFKNPVFYQDELRLLYIVGSEHFKSELTFGDYLITDIENAPFIDRPTFITHYLPFTFPREETFFANIADQLKRKKIPVVFLSSFPQNLIQQIPKGQLGLPTYEFSVKNHFLALPHENNSPWFVLTDRRSDYLILDFDFINSYWHIHVSGKDEQQELIFERDLTLYQTKPNEGRNRRRAR